MASMKRDSTQSMRLFSNLQEHVPSSPSCVLRSCCLRVVRLQVFRALESELKAIVICVAMQGSRRSLRSDQIPVQPSGVDVDLDLVFTLQYPHFLKRRENRLQITLQRRKKYKTRTILGYKTLAVGHINMAQVLQGWYSQQLHLYTKDSKSPAATLTIASLSSEPIEREIQDRRRTVASINEKLSSSDEEADEDSSSSDVEDSAGEMENARETYSRRGTRHRKLRSRNLKQKIIQVLFKKLKATDLGDVHKELEEQLNVDDDEDNEFLFEEDDDDDDSDNDSSILEDNASIASGQKPGLQPYFDHSKSQTMLDQNTLTKEEAKELSAAISVALKSADQNDENNANDDGEGENGLEKLKENIELVENHSVFSNSNLSIPSNQMFGARSTSFKEKRQGKVSLQRKRSVDLDKQFHDKAGFIEQLSSVLGHDDKIPEYIFMISSKEEVLQHLALKLTSKLRHVICTSNSADIQSTIAAVLNKFQKFTNRNSVPPTPLKIGIIGPKDYLRSVVKNYVEQFSQKPQEYQNFTKFLIIPTSQHKVASYLSHLDQKYHGLFFDAFWKTVFENNFMSDTDLREVERRILNYVEHADSFHSIPIAEAMLTCRLPNGESSQLFIPFVTEVKMGMIEGCSNIDGADSDPESSNNHEKISRKEDSLSSSPRNDMTDSRSNQTQSSSNEKLDLQVDYWPITSPNKKEDRKEIPKLSIKGAFRTFCVSRLPTLDNEECNGLSFSASTKCRNKGVKRLMKQRDKDSKGDKESKSIINAAVSKLICTTKSSGHTFSVVIDGKEWHNVKFFVLSSQWPTHIKQFPIGMFLNYGVNNLT